jgi:hypothetical protein
MDTAIEIIDDLDCDAVPFGLELCWNNENAVPPACECPCLPSL